MTPDIAICLGILASAIMLFVWDRVPPDVVALGTLLAIIASGLLPAEKAFAGFASDTVVMILGLLLMSAGLIQTGVVEIAGHRIFEVAGRNPDIFLPVLMASAAIVSAFMSNTAATAFFVPLVIGYAGKIGASPSRFLLPLAFASILSSSVTLISTSTNLVVSDYLTRIQQPAMGMFELAPVGLPIAITGLLYMWLVGTRLLPDRQEGEPADTIGERFYQADVVVVLNGALVGKSLKGALRAGSAGLKVTKLLRDKVALTGEQGRLAEASLRGGDELVIEGLRADLLKVKEIDGLDFKAEMHLPDGAATQDELMIVEGVLLPRSPLIGYSLKRLDFKERYGLQVLALHRAGRVPATISTARLRLGDVLLLQGRREDVRALERGNLFNIFGEVETARLNFVRAPLAAGIFVLAIASVTFQLTSLPVAALGGAFLMLATRCVSPEQAYAQVEWKVLILIGALLSLGAAMESSGTGSFLAQRLIGLIGRNPLGLLSCFFALTVALTQPMSNQAAALVVLPIAIETGVQIGTDPRAFAMIVALAASCSYLTPLEPSCLLVYGPGKYRFWDFFKVGAPLTLITYLIAILLVPHAWPL